MFFLLRGQKWVLYSSEQSKRTPIFWISLFRENFARKLYFSKIRPTITMVKMTFSSFFGTLCSNRPFPKKLFQIFVEKKNWKGSAYSSLVKYKTIGWYWRWVNPKLEKNYTFRNPTKNKTRCFFYWEVRNGFCTVPSNRNEHPFFELACFGKILPEKFIFQR